MNQSISAFGKLYTFSTKGAELISAIDIHSQFEFIWQADPEVWPRHAPILFPIVGKLKNNEYRWNNQLYSLSQHGFARDIDFEIQELYTDLISFKLESNAETKTNYPFDFCLIITYQALENGLSMSIQIQNKSDIDMPFSFGLHPGFNLPEENLAMYELQADRAINWNTEKLLNGLLAGENQLLAENQPNLSLNPESFKNDALVFKQYNSKFIELKHRSNTFSIKVDTSQFPFLGIWNKYPNQSFICLEPWAGIADSVNTNSEFKDKEGILNLEAGQTKTFETFYELHAASIV
jgi:galactose mutarotase-like enzyme